MILRLGDCNPTDTIQAPDGTLLCLSDMSMAPGVQPVAPAATPSVTSLPPFCDPTWTAMNGGVCTDAMGNYRTATGASVTSDQIIAALKTPVGASAIKLPFNIDTNALAFIMGGLVLFFFVLPRGRR